MKKYLCAMLPLCLTKKRVLSLLLCLVMVVGLLPTTALAAANWNLKLNETTGIVTWNQQGSETEYGVRVEKNGFLVGSGGTVTGTSLDLWEFCNSRKLSSGSYEFKVGLKDQGAFSSIYERGKWESIPFFFTSTMPRLPEPQNLRWDGAGGTWAMWDSVDGAEEYAVTLKSANGYNRYTKKTSYPQFDFWTDAEDGYLFTVVAIGSGYRDSEPAIGPKFKKSVTAPAEGKTRIEIISASVTAPAEGKTREDAKPVISTENVSLYAYDWKDNQDNTMTTFDAFQAGKTYRLYIRASSTKEFTSGTTATVNGQSATVQDQSGNTILFYCDFTVPSSKPDSLSRIDAAITTPVAGAKPSFTATATANGYTFSNVRWWELDGDREYVADVGANDTFKPNTWYYLWIDATPSEGYEFTATPGAYINGEKGGSTAKGAGSKVREIYKTYKTGAANQTLFSIAVTTPPTKTEYTVGNNFDPAGMVVTATYTDKTTAAVTGYTVSPSGKLGESDKTVTVSYTEGSVTKTATTPITVKAPTKVLESIAITKAPTKTEYTVGNNFDPAGMVVTATYADKTTAAVTGYTVSPSGKLGESDKTVTVSYTEGSVTKTATQAITVAKGTVSTMKFTDVPSSAYYSNAVSWAVDKGITSGTSGTTFSPNADCTRAQIVTFLWRTAGSPAPKNSVMTFTDVPDSAYYRDAVLWAVEQKITSGTSATTFSPSSACTRSQAVTFLYRFANSPKPGGKASFSDVPDGSYYADAVTWAKEQNITSGTSATTFSPNSTCTRAQIVTFLYRLLGE